MITDAYITAICDGCGDEEEIRITATARGYDDRNVERDIKNLGWIAEGENTHYCADCAVKLGKTKDEEE